ncbi:MAG TPA: 3-isopropylmalate dehydratase small subunit [Candidatus Thermoplasmatota archaeon]|nr:3-isopropylmalate dehydratase small subunit [Candidatus Thermoplasmatota archaeon]
MQTHFTGKTWVFGDNIDTDQITPGKYLAFIDAPTLGKYVLEGARADFPKLVKPGDIIVAGRNFGCGSSREHAPLAIKGAGVSVVIAESYARIFFRNAFNVGLPILVCEGIHDAVKEGDELDVNLTTGKVTNKTTGKTLQAEALTDKAIELLEIGGLVPLTRKKLEERKAAGKA